MTNEKYIAGTRRGLGIASKRDDEKEIAEQRELIGKVIKMKMEEQGLSLRQLSEKSSVHFPQVQRMVKGDSNYTVDTMLRVFNALGMKAEL